MQGRAVPSTTVTALYWRPLAWLWGVLLGTALQLQQVDLWPAAWYGALALGGVAATLGLVRIKPRAPWLDRMGCCLAAMALAFGAAGWRAEAQMQTVLNPALEGVDLQVEGVIVAMPLAVPAGQRFRLAVQSATLAAQAGHAVQVPPLVDVAWYGRDAFVHGPARPAAQGAGDVPELVAGQRWRLPLRLKAPHGSINPHGFDYELWMWEQGVQATGYVRSGHGTEPQLLAPAQGYAVERLRQAVRDAMVQRLARGAGTDPELARIAGVLVALVTGEQRAIDREDWRLFRTTGVAHLMAISGLHITLFAWAAALLIGWGWRRSARLCLWQPAPRVALIGGVLCALLYALFSGWGVPAQRTVLMLAVVALLRLSGRQWPWYVTWLVACVAVVLAQPMALLQAGFWLSFVAVGILFASDFIAASAHQERSSGLKHLKSAAWKLLREQWVVTVAITPLSLLLFGQVSLVGLLANLVAIPWVTWVVTPLALLGVALPVLWDLAAWAMQPLMVLLHGLAAWPQAALWLPVAPWWAALAAVAGGICLVLPLPWPLRLLGLPCILPALWWQPLRPAPGQFELLALDVGQGQAVLVQTARHSLLYDAGPQYGPGSNAGDRVVAPTLRAVGARGLDSGSLDLLVISHADTDHTGGAQAVVQQLRPLQMLGSLLPQERDGLGVVGVPWRDCVADLAWEWDGVRFAVLHPESALEVPDSMALPGKGSLRSGNSRSCVLRITAAAQQGHAASALLLGDLERPQEQWLLQRYGDTAAQALQADAMLVPHHGSNTSSGSGLLAAVQPRWALVQSGYRNRFGHPAPPVVQRYQQQGIALYSTVGCGAARWQSAAPHSLHCERANTLRYWRHRVDDGSRPHQPGAPVPTAPSTVPDIEEINLAPMPDEG